MTATIDRTKLPTDELGRPLVPMFVRTVDANGNLTGTGAASGVAAVTGTLTAAASATLSSGASASTGIIATTSMSAAFAAVPGKAIVARLRGPFVASVRLIRSIDAGTSWDPITVAGSAYGVFSAPAYEAIDAADDTGVLYALECTAYTSGTVTYRLGHS